jgi:23S rRNA pseudouridine2604 synthase
MTNPSKRNNPTKSRRSPGRGGPSQSRKHVGTGAPRRKTTSNQAAMTLKSVVTPSITAPRSLLEGVRINKYLADIGIASRREADVLITDGKVLLNGAPAMIGDRVRSTDTVTLAGDTKQKQYLAYYKGRGIITHSPGEKEVDIITRLQKDYRITGLAPVGRLDKDSEGLIILSNDGRITGPLLDPEANHEKEYSVVVDKNVTPVFAKLMELGVDIEGYRTKAAKVILSTKNQKRFNLIITEGKKHQIRRMCAALGYQIDTLKRVRVINIEIGALKPNQYRKLTGEELHAFLTTLNVS